MEILVLNDKKCNYVPCEKTEIMNENFKLCGACKKVKYCSPECQKLDWKDSHKKLCKNEAVVNLSLFLDSKMPDNSIFSDKICGEAILFYGSNASKTDECIVFVRLNRKTKTFEFSIDKKDIKLIYTNSSQNEKEFIQNSSKFGFLIIYIYDVNEESFRVYRVQKLNFEDNNKTKLIKKIMEY